MTLHCLRLAGGVIWAGNSDRELKPRPPGGRERQASDSGSEPPESRQQDHGSRFRRGTVTGRGMLMARPGWQGRYRAAGDPV